jgi:hypothetical protein
MAETGFELRFRKRWGNHSGFLTIPFRRDIIHRPIFTIAGELRSLVHAANKSDARTEFLP